MTINSDYVIYIENTIIGNYLYLEINNKKVFSTWAVKDNFNGLSRESSINEPISGFYKAENMVDLYIYDSKHKETIIKNVKIIKKANEEEEVTLDV
jgi:hypothetical protein